MANGVQHRNWVSTTAVLAIAIVVLGSTMLAAQSAQEPAYSYKVLYDFCSLENCADGGAPWAGLIQDAKGNLYSTTAGGGGTGCLGAGCGTVFKLSKSGKETVLYAFAGGTDGANPTSSLVRDSAGNLYGTTRYDGDLSCQSGGGCGTVFKVDSKGHETVLHRFHGGSDGMIPYAGLIRDSAGNLYGTTSYGGSTSDDCGDTGWGCGTVFKVTKSGKETILHRFDDGADYGVPRGGLLMDAKGNLYGTTYGNGTASPGTVFKVTPDGKETVLYTFKNGADGNAPLGSLVMDAEGNLYGTTSGLDFGTYGTVFKLSKRGKETVLWDFQGYPDGAYPEAGVVMDAAGNLYGTTWEGGNHNCVYSSAGCGTVFRVTKNGVETVLYRFTGGSDGAFPYAPLLLDATGNLYGTNPGGYSAYCPGGCGVVFRMTRWSGRQDALAMQAGGVAIEVTVEISRFHSKYPGRMAVCVRYAEPCQPCPEGRGRTITA